VLGGRPLTSLEQAKAFHEALGEMLKAAKAKRFQLGTRESIMVLDSDIGT